MTLSEMRACVLEITAPTVMANAFRKAFNIPQRWYWPKRKQIVSTDKYADMEYCMKNYGSPLDGRF